MRSGWLPLAVLFAAAIASRNEMRPSAPMLAISAAMLEVSPSAASLVVSTTSVLKVSLSLLTSATSAALMPL